MNAVLGDGSTVTRFPFCIQFPIVSSIFFPLVYLDSIKWVCDSPNYFSFWRNSVHVCISFSWVHIIIRKCFGEPLGVLKEGLEMYKDENTIPVGTRRCPWGQRCTNSARIESKAKSGWVSSSQGLNVQCKQNYRAKHLYSVGCVFNESPSRRKGIDKTH